jgi:N-dimethylarginine dimethylaminohydrolase
VRPGGAVSVRNEWEKLRSVLLCKPEHFALQPINAIAQDFIRQGRPANHEQVLREHQDFARALLDGGVDVVWAEPDPRRPYQVFTRDIGVTTPLGVLLGAFREPLRQGEEQRALAAIKDRVPIWQCIDSGPGAAFEGGDFIYVDEEHALLGMGGRTNPEGVRQVQSLGARLGLEIVAVPFEPKFLHLDMIFNVVGARTCAICGAALPDSILQRVKKWHFETIEVPVEGVMMLNCNLLALAEGVVISPARNVDVNLQLRAFGFEVIEVELAELLKGGGGPHCLCFPLERRP